MTESWGGRIPTSVRDYYSLRLYRYSYVLFFTPPILPLYAGNSPMSTLPYTPPPTPLRTTPTHSDYCRPQDHPSTWMSPGCHYLVSILAVSLVSPQESHISTMVVSPCLPHVARVSPLYRYSQHLIHATLIAPRFLHLIGGRPSKKRLPMVPAFAAPESVIHGFY